MYFNLYRSLDITCCLTLIIDYIRRASFIRRVPAIFEQTTEKEIAMMSMFTGKAIYSLNKKRLYHGPRSKVRNLSEGY